MNQVDLQWYRALIRTRERSGLGRRSRWEAGVEAFPKLLGRSSAAELQAVSNVQLIFFVCPQGCVYTGTGNWTPGHVRHLPATRNPVRHPRSAAHPARLHEHSNRDARGRCGHTKGEPAQRHGRRGGRLRRWSCNRRCKAARAERATIKCAVQGGKGTRQGIGALGGARAGAMSKAQGPGVFVGRGSPPVAAALSRGVRVVAVGGVRHAFLWLNGRGRELGRNALFERLCSSAAGKRQGASRLG